MSYHRLETEYDADRSGSWNSNETSEDADGEQSYSPDFRAHQAISGL